MKLSVIIVNYNVKYFLEQALLSVQKASQNLPVEVYVVDNNSVDDSVPMVREKFPKVKVIANKDNPGFSIANNQAIRESSGEYVLLLNPDTVVEEDCFEKVINFMDAHPDAGGLGVKMIDGSGKFLPESKRGFPAPFVAFCKTFGLSKLFPKSKTFNRYHLGFLSKDENHEIEVLSGAFMFLRKSVLDEVGLLDEAFFMYGEDIDLSYRIVKAGYKNYYFADTTIIHYKGESTKKGSLNYVRTFYKAMIIFAQKHFKGERAWLFILMLQFAIYFRAFLTIVSNTLKKIYLPILDAGIIYTGIYFLKNFWATRYHNNPEYYDESFMQFNVPLYISIWLISVFFSGGYDKSNRMTAVARGLMFGTLLLAAVYGFLDAQHRPSRMLLLLGAVWATLSMLGLRSILHFIKHRNFNFSGKEIHNLVIVGSVAERERVQKLLYESQVKMNFIGTVSPSESEDYGTYLGNLAQLNEVVQIYNIDEIIFCSKDVLAQDITHWMSHLGPEISYKIVPKESLSIIGSSSKNTAGDLYTIDVQFQIAQETSRRNKLVLDILLSILLLVFSPLCIWFIRKKASFFSNCFAVLFRKKTWVGYHSEQGNSKRLPALLPSVLNPLSGIKEKQFSEETIKRINLLYAKDYTINNDLNLIRKGFTNLGN